MKILRISLTAFFVIFAAIGIGALVTGKGSIFLLILSALCVATGLSLNNKGGKTAKYISYFTAGLLCLFLIASVYILISPLLGEKFDTTLFILMLSFGSVGAATIYCLKNKKTEITKPNTHNTTLQPDP